jgi:sirohydrochlorin cobaltochelatase
MTISKQRGIILFAHGSRDPLWRRPIENVANLIQLKEPSIAVKCAFLELTEPDLQKAARELVADGVQHLSIVPFFIGIGKHAREDLPRLIESLRIEFPSITIECQPTIGENEKVLDLLASISLEYKNSTF